MTPRETSIAFFSIPQAAKTLKVTEKTVRNYIERGFLEAEKWNGAWRINIEKIEDIFYKKYGKKIEQLSIDQVQNDTSVRISREEYAQLQREAGKLEAAEILGRDLRSELRETADRIAQLEASSASGWTEARKFKEDLQNLRAEVEEARKRESEARLEADWLRRELEKLSQSEREPVDESQQPREKSAMGLPVYRLR